MPRDLKKNDRNEIEIFDPLSGTTLQFYYRMPTTEERVSFETESYHREAGEFKDNTPHTKPEYGAKIITGFAEGAFTFDGTSISSDPANEHYREDWKDLLKETSSDILSLLGGVVFQGVRVENKTAKDKPVPLPKNSDG